MRNVLLLGSLCVLSLSARQDDTPRHIKDQNPQDWETIKKCILLQDQSSPALYTYNVLGYNNASKPSNKECEEVFNKYQNRGWLWNSNHSDIDRLYSTYHTTKSDLSLIETLKKNFLNITDIDNIRDNIKSYTDLSEDDADLSEDDVQHLSRTRELIKKFLDAKKKELVTQSFDLNNTEYSDHE